MSARGFPKAPWDFTLEHRKHSQRGDAGALQGRWVEAHMGEDRTGKGAKQEPTKCLQEPTRCLRLVGDFQGEDPDADNIDMHCRANHHGGYTDYFQDSFFSHGSGTSGRPGCQAEIRAGHWPRASGNEVVPVGSSPAGPASHPQGARLEQGAGAPLWSPVIAAAILESLKLTSNQKRL